MLYRTWRAPFQSNRNAFLRSGFSCNRINKQCLFFFKFWRNTLFRGVRNSLVKGGSEQLFSCDSAKQTEPCSYDCLAVMLVTHAALWFRTQDVMGLVLSEMLFCIEAKKVRN